MAIVMSERVMRLKEVRSELGLLVWFAVDKIISPAVRPKESLVLNGFWRSGTTWVQQVLSSALDAKPVFEPFAEKVPHTCRYLEGVDSKLLMEEVAKPFMPYVATKSDWPKVLEEVVQDSLISTLDRHHYTYAGRQSYKDSLKRAVVVKFVRGALLLPAITQRFSVPTLHLRRDPRMVIASICRQPRWGGGLFEDLSLTQQFLKIPDGREHIFEPFYDDIMNADKGSLVEKIATYWAISEWFIQQSDEFHAGRIILAKYEELIVADEVDWLNLLQSLKLQPKKNFSEWGLNRASFTTQKGREGLLLERRSNSYNDILTDKDIYLIESIVGKYGLEDALL